MLELGLRRAAHEEDAGDDEGDGGAEHNKPTRQEEDLADIQDPRLHLQGRSLIHKDPPRWPQLFGLGMHPIRRE